MQWREWQMHRTLTVTLKGIRKLSNCTKYSWEWEWNTGKRLRAYQAREQISCLLSLFHQQEEDDTSRRRSWGSNAILNDLLSLLAVGKWKFWIVVVVVPWDAWIHSWWVIPMIRVLLRAKNHYHYHKMHVTSTLIFYSTNYDSKWKQASLSEAENGYTSPNRVHFNRIAN